MGKNKKDIESMEQMISILDRVKSSIEILKSGEHSIKEACEMNDISYAAFRRVVFSTDWEVCDEYNRESFKKKFENSIPLYHWTEILFCDVMGLPHTPSSVEKMPTDVRETMEKAVSILTEREQFVIRLFYDDNLTKEEIAELIGRSPERVRQIKAKAMRKLAHPSRHGYIVFGDNYYCSKRKAYDDVYNSAVIEAKKHEITKLDYIIERKKQGEQGKQGAHPRGFFGTDEITELNLSIRSFNCLYRAGVHTIDDLCSLTESELMSVRNLGRKSFDEICKVMNDYGLKLTEDVMNN